MKTVLIIDMLDTEITFMVVDGDLSSLNKKYINSCEISEEDSDVLVNLLFTEEGESKPALNEFPIQAVLDGAKVITVGFLP